jgi:hypothetical protein
MSDSKIMQSKYRRTFHDLITTRRSLNIFALLRPSTSAPTNAKILNHSSGRIRENMSYTTTITGVNALRWCRFDDGGRRQVATTVWRRAPTSYFTCLFDGDMTDAELPAAHKAF